MKKNERPLFISDNYTEIALKQEMEYLNSKSIKKYFPLIIFAIAMGFLEAIVVVYIRELYYPDGFRFPLKALPSWLIGIEWIREICTLLMLGSVAWISGKIFLKRLSVFLFLFGIWDIIYYVALKLFLDWPESLLTWDILFLIPITWASPVLAPIICSVFMIFMAIEFDYLHSAKNLNKLKIKELAFLFGGAAVIYFTFTYDFGMLILKGNYLKDFLSLAENTNFLNELTTLNPTKYNWSLFSIGILIICAGCSLIYKRAIAEAKI